ncbi:MAG: PAS domain S-box protein [Candidatus Eremiobacterota bacterium]
MKKIFTLSMRINLIFLILLSVVPVFAIMIYTGMERRNIALKNANYSTLQLVRNIAIQEEQASKSIHQLITILSELDITEKTSERRGFLEEIMKENPFCTGIIITDKHGNILFSTDSGKKTSLAGESFFQDAIKENRLVAGEYTEKHIYKQAVLPFACTATDRQGHIKGVIIAFFNLELYGQSFLQAELPEGSNLIFCDSRGRILKYYPSSMNYEGEYDLPGLMSAMTGQPEEGTFTGKGLDGIQRLYAFKKLTLGEKPYLFIRAGIPLYRALSEVNHIMVRNTLLLLSSLLITISAGWFLGNIIIINRLKKLLSASLKLGLGDMKTRTNVPHTTDEVGQLARSFDKMAEALEKREEEKETSRQALRMSEEKYRKLVEQLNEGILAINREGIITFANQAFCNITGYRREEITGTNLLDYVREETAKKVREKFEIHEKMWSEHFEIILKRKDGKEIYTIFSNSSILDEKENYSGIFSVVMDITERKKSQEELLYRLSVEELITDISSKFINITADEIDSEINFALETTGKFLGVKFCYINIFSKDLKDIEKHYRWCDDGFVPHSDLSPREFITDFQMKLDGETIKWEEFSYRTELAIPMVIEKSLIGSLVFNSENAERVWRKEDVRLLRLLGEIFVNVFERRRSIEEKRQIEEHLWQSQKMESLGIMAGGIAHDFNNILAGMLGYAELTMMDIPEDSPLKGNIDEIINSINHAANITRQILNYTGRGSIVRDKINLNELIRKMEKFIKISVSKKCNISYNLSEELPLIECDRTQIEQVIINFVINASEAIGGNQGTISIKTGTKDCDRYYIAGTYLKEQISEGLYVFLEISDTGCGMTEEVKDKIFDPFFTTKFLGRGLGLAAVLGIIRGHKGAIRVSTSPGEGTTMTVLFPALKRKEITVKTGEKTFETFRGTGTFLIVDDEKSIRTVAESFLRKSGFDVLTASNGKEGIEIFKLKGQDICAVILDMTMPDLSGKETYDELCKIRSDVKVIISSGYSKEEVYRQFGNDGIRDFLQKPYEFKSFMEVIKKYGYA